jgi:aryl-alcohol dehydrogenase-like predicted oxidoreductase
VELVDFGRTELRVAPLCLGAMNFGTPGWGCDEQAAAEIVGVYRDAGGNFFDTANIYGGGESERILGRLLAGCRGDVVIASKVGFPSPDGGPWGLAPASIRASLEGTLQRLGTDHLDLYQMHSFDASVPLDETLGALDALIDEGLIRHAGCSNFFAWQISHAGTLAARNSWRELASAQMLYSLIRRDLEREHFGYAQAFGTALIAYSPLHGGQLAAAWRNRDQIPADSRAVENPDVYLSDEDRVFRVTDAVVDHAALIGATPGQVALAWVVRQPAITSTLTAARSAAELQEQLRALSLDADEGFWSSLERASAMPLSYPSDFYARIAARATATTGKTPEGDTVSER